MTKKRGIQYNNHTDHRSNGISRRELSEIINTKLLIAEKMSELIEKRSLDKITVKDLVEECGISRQTFYYHFQDLFDVVEWMMERILERKIEEGLCISDPEEALYGMLTYTPKQKEILANLMRSQRREQIERAVIRNLRVYLKRMIISKNPDIRLSEIDMEVLLDFWAFGIVGVLVSSFSRNDSDERRLAKQIVDIVSGEAFKSDRHDAP